jgi:PKD repeat protein
MNREYKLLMSLLIIICVVGGFLNVNIASSVDTTLYVDPAMKYALEGESFTVNLKVANVERLHLWQVNMSFDPTVLKFINVTEGDFLQKEGKETTGMRYLDGIEDGWALFTWSIVGSYYVSGSGLLAKVEFEVLTTGESKLHIVTEPVGGGYVMTFLIKMNPAPVPPGGKEEEEIPFTAVDGIFYNLEVPPVALFTYSPETPMVNAALTFNASSSYTTAPREIEEYYWDFNDGTNGTGVTVDHAYTNSGKYNVTLIVIDDANATALVEAMYNTTRMPRIWYELYSKNTKTIEVKLGHNIAITSVQASLEEVEAGETVSINVTALNKGTETESFNVTVYYGNNAIEKKAVTALTAGAEETLIFNWDTTGVAGGDYQIWAEATDVEGEGYVEDNKFIDGTVTVKSAGQSLPITIIVGAVVAVAAVAIILFMYLRRRSAPKA